MNPEVKITEPVVKKLLETIDAGLVCGLGSPHPGQMCVEAAVCYALGLPHGDDPGCVDPAVRSAKIKLNDSLWSSPRARAAGLRAVAVAQLGSKGVIDTLRFCEVYAELIIRRVLPVALEAAGLPHAALRCAREGTAEVAHAALRCAREGTAEVAITAYFSARGRADAVRLNSPKETTRYSVLYEVANACRFAHLARYQAGDFSSAAVHSSARAVFYANNGILHRLRSADAVLALGAEAMLEALKAVNSPGCKFLHLL